MCAHRGGFRTVLPTCHMAAALECAVDVFPCVCVCGGMRGHTVVKVQHHPIHGIFKTLP